MCLRKIHLRSVRRSLTLNTEHCTKDANEHILSALDTMCRRSGCTTRRNNVTSSCGSKNGDLKIRDNLMGKRDLVMDVGQVRSPVMVRHKIYGEQSLRWGRYFVKYGRNSY